jgi:hypothetical protein
VAGGRPAGALVFFIAYNGTNIDTGTQRPDWSRLPRWFTEIVLEIPFDHRVQLAFGILYAREAEERIPELLRSEFDDMCVPDNNWSETTG